MVGLCVWCMGSAQGKDSSGLLVSRDTGFMSNMGNGRKPGFKFVNVEHDSRMTNGA